MAELKNFNFVRFFFVKTNIAVVFHVVLESRTSDDITWMFFVLLLIFYCTALITERISSLSISCVRFDCPKTTSWIANQYGRVEC